jgi:hypothetical protein
MWAQVLACPLGDEEDRPPYWPVDGGDPRPNL